MTNEPVPCFNKWGHSELSSRGDEKIFIFYLPFAALTSVLDDLLFHHSTIFDDLQPYKYGHPVYAETRLQTYCLGDYPVLQNYRNHSVAPAVLADKT